MLFSLVSIISSANASLLCSLILFIQNMCSALLVLSRVLLVSVNCYHGYVSHLLCMLILTCIVIMTIIIIMTISIIIIIIIMIHYITIHVIIYDDCYYCHCYYYNLLLLQDPAPPRGHAAEVGGNLMEMIIISIYVIMVMIMMYTIYDTA